MKKEHNQSLLKISLITIVSLIFCFIFTISYSKYVLNANVGTLTLDANGEVIPEKAYLLPGTEFNSIIFEKNPSKIILGNYSKYANEVKDVRTTAIAVDVEQSGVINLYMVDDVAYVLSKSKIYANANSAALFGSYYYSLIKVASEEADYTRFNMKVVSEGLKMKLRTIILENFDSSEVTDMSFMFCNWNLSEIQGLNKLDTHLVENMTNMFSIAGRALGHSTAGLDFSSFNTKNVTKMDNMFSGIRVDYPLDLSYFDTRNVKSMNGTFCNGQFVSLDVSTWNTENVTDMNSMFEGTFIEELDLSSFDTHNVSTMNYMFGRCSQDFLMDRGSYINYPITYYVESPLKTIYVDSTKWSTSGRNNSTIFSELLLNLIGEQGTEYRLCDGLDGARSGRFARVDGYEGLPGYFTEKGHLPYQKDVNFDKKAVLNPREKMTGTYDYGKAFDVHHIVFGKYSEGLSQLQQMVCSPENILELNDGSLQPIYSYKVDVDVSVDIGQNIVPIVLTEKIYDDLSVHTFHSENTLYLLSRYDTMIYAPEDCSNLFGSNYSFYYNGTYYLKNGLDQSLRALKTIDFNHCFDTSNTTKMIGMFSNHMLEEIKGLDTLDTTHVTDMSGMFLNARRLNSLDLSHFDTSNVEHMNAMFGNIGLETLDLSSFDTHKVKSMEIMFGWTIEPLVRWTTSNRYELFDMYALLIRPRDSKVDFDVLFSYDDSNSPLKTIFVDKDKWSTEAIVNKETEQIWYGRFNNLMGGNGTHFDAILDFHGDPLRTATYACIDSDETPGYLTAKE